MKGVVIGSVTAGALGLSLAVAAHTARKNHDCAFCALLTELWIDDTDAQRVHELQAYMNTSIYNQVFNRPPYQAYERFKDANVLEIDRKCLTIAQQEAEKLHLT